MTRFLAFVVRGRTQAILVASLFLLLPLTGFVSGGVVGLVTLRYGVFEGAVVLLATLGLGSGAGLLLFDGLLGVLAFGLMIGVPVLLLAAVLRATSSQGVTLAFAGLLGALVIGVLHLATGDPAAWWRGVLERMVQGRIRASGEAVDPAAMEELAALLDVVASWMSVVVVSMVLAALMVLYLARWWQALLDNPGGFGREFRALRMDRRVAYATIGVAVFALISRGWAGGLGGVLFNLAVMLYGVQGVAIAHSLAARYRGRGGLLVLMYVVLVFMPPVLALPLAVAGFSDTWLDIRRRLDANE